MRILSGGRKTEERELRNRHPWAFALLTECICMAILSAVASLCGLFLGGWALSVVYNGSIWLVQPALGAFLCFYAAKKGVPAILAWPFPCMCFALVYWCVVGMPPPAGAALLSAVVCVAGASAGEVWLKRSKS